jgi:CheY-like chemotaxis protein
MPADEESQPFNIFLVDDVELNNFITSRLLNKVLVSPMVTAFDNGRRAIDELRSLQAKGHTLPDFIFLDVHMPILNGWEFLAEFERLRIDPEGRIRIYILSSSVLKADISQAGRIPAVKGFITKPICTAELQNIFNIQS